MTHPGATSAGISLHVIKRQNAITDPSQAVHIWVKYGNVEKVSKNHYRKLTIRKASNKS